MPKRYLSPGFANDCASLSTCSASFDVPETGVQVGERRVVADFVRVVLDRLGEVLERLLLVVRPE